jgi:integrase/recombinase XerD
MEQVRAILNAPDLATRSGVRDRAMMHLCFAGGLRVSELVGVLTENLSLQHGASVTIGGKGRKERCLPLWKDTARDLRAWLSVRGAVRVPELFVNAQDEPMTRAGFEYVLDKHVRAAAETCPSLRSRSISPHQLRHSCAVIMLQATHDIRKVALWLGHADIRTTEVYLRMDPSEKARGSGSGRSARAAPRSVQGAGCIDRLFVGERIYVRHDVRLHYHATVTRLRSVRCGCTIMPATSAS